MNDNNTNAKIMGGLVVVALIGVVGLMFWSPAKKSNLSGVKSKKKK